TRRANDRIIVMVGLWAAPAAELSLASGHRQSPSPKAEKPMFVGFSSFATAGWMSRELRWR
ncbi:MAG: hypothetical protein ABW061_11785, partial [Polyangiaceae bacterium]